MAGELSLKPPLQDRFHHLLQETALTGQLQLASVDLGQHLIETARGLQRLERLPARIQPVYRIIVVAVTGLTVPPNNHGHHRAPSGSCDSYTNHLIRPRGSPVKDRLGPNTAANASRRPASAVE